MIKTRRQAEELAEIVESGSIGPSDARLARVYREVAGRFRPEPAPVERVLARVTRTLEKSPPGASPRSPRLRLWRR